MNDLIVQLHCSLNLRTKQLRKILVECHVVLGKQRKGIEMNTKFRVKLTPKIDKAVYDQKIPMSIHLKEDLIFELALMHKHGKIMLLPFSKYASQKFARRKRNGKLPLLVDLRKVNSLIADENMNNNHPLNPLSDTAQQLAVKFRFCKLVCSRACHCLRKGDQRSMEKSAFAFASRAIKTCKRSEQICVCICKLHVRLLGPRCHS